MNRELSLEFVRVTEAAAIACGHLVGRGDKNGADGLAARIASTARPSAPFLSPLPTR